MRLYS